MGFEELIRKLSPTIKRIAYKLNGRYRTFGHDDLCQEALMHLWVHFMSGNLSDKTSSYILQGCYFHLKNYIRKINEKPDLSLDAIIYLDNDNSRFKNAIVDNCQEGLRELLGKKLLAQKIQDNGFNSKEKTILASLSEGLTTREIGGRLGISHVMVVRLISKIRKKCQKYID